MQAYTPYMERLGIIVLYVRFIYLANHAVRIYMFGKTYLFSHTEKGKWNIVDRERCIGTASVHTLAGISMRRPCPVENPST